MTATMIQTYRILAADKLAQQGLDYIQSQPDAELVSKPGLSEEELAAIIGEYDALIVRSGVTVTSAVLENPGRLKVIARAGVGVDNIDLPAATSKGILVINTAEASTVTTAEHAFALMMALARNIGPAYRKMAEGGWDRGKFQGRQLFGKTLGVAGFGRIGRTVAERALAFGMKVVAFDPMISSQTEMDGKVRMFRDFAEMCPHVDIISFHVPLNDQTRGMLNDDTFALCREGVLIVNAARGGVVDEAALIRAADSGQCAGAALDVYTNEPPAADDPLRTHPNILCTPHLGASTVEAQEAVSIGAAEAALDFLRGNEIRGAVNAGNIRLDLDLDQAAYVDLAHRMARMQSPLLTNVKSVTVEITGRKLAKASETIQRMALIGLLSDHLAQPLNIVNVKHVAEQYHIDAHTVIHEDESSGTQLVIQSQSADGMTRRIVGRVYEDLKPRIVEIDRYFMDMLPAGWMVLLKNEDRPGMIGSVGNAFGQAGINIADMTISRREETALMVLKVDAEPTDTVLRDILERPGILKIAKVKLPEDR